MRNFGRDFECEQHGQSFRTDENGVSVSQQVLDFAVSAAFQGLSKSERKNLAKEAPVPHQADLRAKKVDRFIKKYFKRKGTLFNPSMDRWQLNLAARILDPIGPPTQLWEAALAANEHQTGLDPSVVVEFVCQAISLVGNASFCGLSDRRKSLLAKVSSKSLDLLDCLKWILPIWQAYSINSDCLPGTLALSPPPTPQKSRSWDGKWL